MSCWNKEQLENMLEDVVNELDLSDSMIKKHGPLGTPPAELVREVLYQKDLQIKLLQQGAVDLSNMPSTAPYSNDTTSKDAAKKIEYKLTGLRNEVYNYINFCKEHGATTSETASATGISILTVRPRCSELYESAYIIDSGQRRKNNHDIDEIVWLIKNHKHITGIKLSDDEIKAFKDRSNIDES